MSSSVSPMTGTLVAATTMATAASGPKRRKLERRERLRKTALCKHFDKPGGCPFPDCKFAHGRGEVADAGMNSVAAQRQLIREQTSTRAEERFQAREGSAGSLRGSMVERYYTQLFSCDTMGKLSEDQFVHMHSNRLCVIGVAESHPLMREQVTRVEFTSNVLDSRVSGKKKKGGSFLLPQTILCHVHCVSGKVFVLRGCVRGTLLEFNERLLEQPSLLLDKPLSEGYLAIAQPKQNEVAEIQASLLSKDEYEQFRAISAARDEATASSEAVVPETETATETAAETLTEDTTVTGESTDAVVAPTDATTASTTAADAAMAIE